MVLVGIVTFVVWKRLDLTAADRSTPFDSVVFVIWVALLLAPIFSEVKIWGVELKQEIEKAKKDLSDPDSCRKGGGAQLDKLSAGVSRCRSCSTTGCSTPFHKSRS